MIIYEFSTWTYGKDNGLYAVTEIEVEEKPKSYIGKNCRVLKDDIDKLSTSYGNRMYRLNNDPKPYIKAVIEKKAKSIESREMSLLIDKAELNRWKALQGENKNA